MFVLHERLAADSIEIIDLALSKVILMNDANYPWVILVPRRAGIREIHHLDEADQHQLFKEMTSITAIMEKLFQGEKMNVAALGNMVPQLHIHIIARFEKDAAWPGPVWGVTPAIAYTKTQRDATITQLKEAFLNVGV